MKKSLVYILFLFLAVSCQRKIQHFSNFDYKSNKFDNNTTSTNSKVDAIIEPYKTKLDAQMNVVIGHNAQEMSKGKPSSPLTNFCADAILEEYRNTTGKDLDMVILNYGGIRVNSFGAGDIIVGEMYEIMPFENNLVIMELGKNELDQLFDKIAKSEGWPISKNSGFTIKDSSAINIIINGNPYDKSKTYKVAFPDYIVDGGDDVTFLKNLKRENTGLLLRNLMSAYVKRLNKIVPDKSERVKKFTW